MKWIAILLLSLTLSSCGLKISLKGKAVENNLVAGMISPLVGSISSHNNSSFISTANAAICADPVYAKLFLVLANGAIDESSPIATQLIGADSHYSFDVKELELKHDDNVKYLVKTEGCNDNIYKRPVTNFDDKQNVDAKTTIISEVINANSLVTNTLNEVSRKEIEKLINSVSGSSLTSALTSLTTETAPIAKFTEIFGVSPGILQFARPEARLTLPTSAINELSPTNLAIHPFHVDPNYSFAYSWKLDGVVKSTASNFVYTPSANSSGTHTVDLYVGLDNGSGIIDFTKPYFIKTIEVTVNNNIAPTPPNITLSSANPTPVNTTTVAVDLATGVGLAQCATFSHLAITDTATPPGIGQFNIDCATSGTQTENVTFSNGDGLKTLYIWAMDNEGYISTPKTLSLVLDTLPPVASLSLASTLIKGGTTQTITLSGSDAGTGLASLKLYYSATGSAPFTLLSNLSTTATSYNWNVSAVDTAAAKLQLIATDLTGSTTTVTSGAFVIDSIAPTAPTISRTSSSPNNSTTVVISTTCSSDYAKILYSETSTTPLLNDSEWENCAATKNFVVSAANGTKTIYAFTKDAAGNISTSSNITMSLDNTPPAAPVLTLTSSAISSATAITFTASDCTDRPSLLVSESSTAPLVSDSAWQTCTTSASGITHTLTSATQGSRNLYIFAKDAVGNISTSTTKSMIYDATNPTLSMSTTLASLYKGGDAVTLNFSASDTNGLSTLKLEYAADGSTYSLVSNLSTSATSYNWTIPASNTSSAKIRLVASDNAITANTTTVASATFTVDSTAPTAPTISRTSPNSHNSTTVVIGATCTADYDKILYSETSTTPLLNDSGWENCAATKNFVVGSTNGTKTIYAWTKDLAGNISTSNNVTMTLDTVPPSAPVANLSSSNITSSTALTFTVTDCLDRPYVLVSESITAPAANDSSWQTCVTTASAITHTLLGPATQGTHNLYIFAKDSVGNISLPTLSSVVYDTTKPTITLTTTLAALYKGGDIVTLNFSASDTNGVSSIKIEYAADGATFTNVTSLVGTATTYNWTIPASNTVNAKLKLTATDNATTANTETTLSNTFTVDSTAPSAPLLTRTSGLLTNATLVTMTITSCSDIDAVYINESSITPSGANPGWVACSTAASNYSVLVSGQGLHTVYGWAKDAAGNISTSNNITMTLDTVLPVININAPTAMRGNTSTGNLSWTLTETNVAASTTFLVEIFNGSTWSTLSTPAANTGANTNQAYSLTNFSVPNINVTTAKLRVSLTDAAGNLKTTETAAFSIDSVAPVLSSVSINDGAVYAGTAMVSVKIGVSDNLATGSQIKVRLALSNISTNECQSEYADNNWISWTSASTIIPFTFSPTDGTKKICAWAKDPSGNVTVTSPVMGSLGVNFDDIIYSIGNPPEMTAFTVTRTADGGLTALGTDPLTISWAAKDAEGLDNNPISFSYTTDNSIWKDIGTNLDSSFPANITWYGGLSSNPLTGSGNVLSFSAPGSSLATPYFRVRAQVRDMAGNSSMMVTSQPFNTGAWTVYAGNTNRGDGGTGKAAALYGGGFFSHFAVNPVNGDMYALDLSNAIRKLDAKTGIVSTFIKHGTSNFPESGALPASPVFPTSSYNNLTFDNKGRLYIGRQGAGGDYATIIYQIDLENSYVRRYAGGGLDNDEGGIASALQISSGGYNFDEQNSLYVWTYCLTTPVTSLSYNTVGNRIIKITQNTDGTPRTTSRIIGDCTVGSTTSGATAYSQPATPNGSFVGYASIVPWDNGNNILILPYSTGTRYKILNGKTYPSTVSASYSTGVGKYNPADGYVYKTNPTGVEKVSVNTAGANGDTSTQYFTFNSTTTGCTADGTTTSNYCGLVLAQFDIRAGILYFVDGAGQNATSSYSIRYFDGNNQLRTVFGSQPFYGDGLDKSMMRGSFSGIYYKKSTEPNQTAFPEGLYFMERAGLVLGYINPTTKIVSNLWGNQARIASTPTAGTTISKNLTLGAASTGNAYPLTFDNDGLPWVRMTTNAISVDATNKIVRRSTSSISTNIQGTANTTNPTNYGLGQFVGYQNFTLKNKGLFALPNYVTVGFDPPVTIRYLDYLNLTSPVIIGGTNLYSTNPAASPDITTAGSVATASLSKACITTAPCFMNYNSSNDRLYFVEGTSIRYITTPDNTATATLKTLFTSAASIHNFSFSPDYSQLWYFKSTGGLFCYDISSGKSWCDNTSDFFLIRTAANFSVAAGANQITFKDNQTMFLSTYNGEILQFNLPTTP